MSRTHLLGAVSAAALACLATGAFAQESTTAITGGGSTLAEFDYFNEFQSFNNAQASGAATFDNPSPASGQNVLYWPSGSGSGQAAFLNNDLTCDSNKVLNLNNKACSGTLIGGADTVIYGASDATFTTTQISQWANESVGQAAAGNLIQLPSMGVGVGIPVVNKKVTTNGGVTLTDADLCGIFSGKITNWSGTSAAKKLTAGAITVVYRSDGSGTSFLLLNHFAAVCTSSNSNFVLPITPQTTFANVFTLNNQSVPANFVGESGSQAVASYMAGVSGTTVTSAIGYLSPDFTTIDPKSNAVLTNGAMSPLVVAAVASGSTKGYTPTVTNITNALNHASQGTNLKPPTTAAEGANPTNWVPLIQTVTTGYPIVGYTTFDFAQCYASPTIATAVIAFMTDHYSTNATYATSIANNGFVSITASGAKAFATPIARGILGNDYKWNDNIENATACKGKTGR
jgi:ABC-type phosphate transport system substrate-binding protein